MTAVKVLPQLWQVFSRPSQYSILKHRLRMRRSFFYLIPSMQAAFIRFEGVTMSWSIDERLYRCQLHSPFGLEHIELATLLDDDAFTPTMADSNAAKVIRIVFFSISM